MSSCLRRSFVSLAGTRSKARNSERIALHVLSWTRFEPPPPPPAGNEDLPEVFASFWFAARAEVFVAEPEAASHRSAGTGSLTSASDAQPSPGATDWERSSGGFSSSTGWAIRKPAKKPTAKAAAVARMTKRARNVAVRLDRSVTLFKDPSRIGGHCCRFESNTR